MEKEIQIVTEPNSDGKRYGAEEPTKSFIIPFASTKGDEAIQLYNKGRYKLEPWQEALLCSIMGQDDDGLWVHQKFGYSIPRRNGKSEVAIARCLWGLVHGERILYTAQNTSTAHAIWERLSDLCETLQLDTSTFRAFGREHIYVKDGGRIEFRTRTTTGGMGEGYDLLVLDESQEYTISQQGALKYIVTASQNPQTLMLGTPPTPNSAGTVFPTYRNKVLSGQSKYSGWAEWSVEQMTDLSDLDALYQANPSLGHHLTLRAIEAEAADIESDIDLNIQRFGLWFKYSLKSVISKPDWTGCELEKLPEMTGKIYVGIKFGKSSGNVSMAVARRIKDSDKIFTEVIDCRPVRGGYQWILDFIKQADIEEIAIDGDNGKSSLNDQICVKHCSSTLQLSVRLDVNISM